MCWVRNNPKPSNVVHVMEPKFRADIRSIANAAHVPTDDLFALLSEREQQVAGALSLGLTNREIAKELGISIKTVDTHRGHVLKKLGLRGNVALARAYGARRLLAAIADDEKRCRAAIADVGGGHLADRDPRGTLGG